VVRVTRERARLDGFAALLVGANEHAVRDIQLYYPTQLLGNFGGQLVGYIDPVVVVLLVSHPTSDPRNKLHPCQNITITTILHNNFWTVLASRVNPV
jgi:hypothetical protein